MNVLNKEYLELEEQIQKLSEEWKTLLENETLTDQEQSSAIEHFPLIPQLKLRTNMEQYKSFILDLATLLGKLQPALKEELRKLEERLSEEVLEQWFQEAVAVNEFYFEQFAKDHQIADWLPMFTAEHAVRPYLQKAAAEVKDRIQRKDIAGGCPCCGEPPRIAVYSKTGKKEMTCPRCLYSWEIKKIKCAHCGNEDHEKIEIIKVEKEDLSEIHACKECKGYTKVIDTRKLIKKEGIQLLDSKSIHLDFIAQENGYGVPNNQEAH